MTETTGELFDSSGFITDRRYLIPQLLGRQVNQFLDTVRLVYIELADGPVEAYKPVEEEHDDDLTSRGYADNSDFRFDRWVPHHSLGRDGEEHFQAYLAGFPKIFADGEIPRDCIHVWCNNSDVLDYTNMAIHLGSLSGLYVYSELRTNLQIELDELSYDDVSPRYEIPILRHKRTGQEYYRDASYEDIDLIIRELDEKPTKVFTNHTKKGLNAFRNATDTQLETLLD